MSDVARIQLLGAPRTVLYDDEAVAEGAGRLLAALGLEVVEIGAHAPTLTAPSVAVLGRDHEAVADCYAWFVGPGPTPPWMHATAGRGATTTELILALLGTGFAQERAGAAFRAAGAGLPTPRSSPYDAVGILDGITAAVAPVPTEAESAQHSTYSLHRAPLDENRRLQLLRASLAALEECCADNGAIAAAPRRAADSDPDYWFFWQRDAAHVAVALHALARHAPDEELRARARARLDGYVDFVSALGPALATDPVGLATSRCSMAGTPVGHYGDPQHDGPAATALAVLTAVEDPRTALAVARPFLDHLLRTAPEATGFDLWELTFGTSLHAVNLARRALRRAAESGRSADDPAAEDYQRAADGRAALLSSFRRPEGGLVHRRPRAATSGLDMSALGSVLFAYDVTDDVLNLDDPDLVATSQRLEAHYLTRWPVNAAWRHAGHLGGGVGRFPEDCNDGIGSGGGNPWPVTTLWAAQHHLCRIARARHVARPDEPLDHDRERAVGLGFLDFVLSHSAVGGNLELSEQIDGATGRPRGARELAWAHAELVTTLLLL